MVINILYIVQESGIIPAYYEPCRNGRLQILYSVIQDCGEILDPHMDY